MEKAYLLLVHKDPDHLIRLIGKLDDGSSRFFIHIDLKAVPLFSNALTILKEKITLINSIELSWGGYSIVHATIRGLRKIKLAGKFDRIILLSGQDYPIKNNEAINAFLENSKFSNFIEYFTIPNYEKWDPRGGLYRIDKYFMGLKTVQVFQAKTLNMLSMLFPFFRRKHPGDLQAYAGSQWWIIDDYALNYLLDFIDTNPDYLSFHRFTFAPDEVFFHTILLNTTDRRLKNSIQNDHLRYMIWKTKEQASPLIIPTTNLTDLLRSPTLFARKFESGTSDKVLALIDQNIG